LIERRVTPVILERGAKVAASAAEWGHVQLFSPWRYNIDATAAALLETTGWQRPEDEVVPTGADLLTTYLEPLAAYPAIAKALKLNAEVEAIVRQDPARSDRKGAVLPPSSWSGATQKARGIG
jgi:hypothetical protein